MGAKDKLRSTMFYFDVAKWLLRTKVLPKSLLFNAMLYGGGGWGKRNIENRK
jgi:hypothetical protein